MDPLFLKIGITLTCLRAWGNLPVLKDLLNISERIVAQMGIKLIFESKLYIVEKDQSTLPDDEKSISRNVAKRKYTWSKPRCSVGSVLRSWWGILYGPVALPVSRDFMILFTSSGVVGVKKKKDMYRQNSLYMTFL